MAILELYPAMTPDRVEALEAWQLRLLVARVEQRQKRAREEQERARAEASEHGR